MPENVGGKVSARQDGGSLEGRVECHRQAMRAHVIGIGLAGWRSRSSCAVVPSGERQPDRERSALPRGEEGRNHGKEKSSHCWKRCSPERVSLYLGEGGGGKTTSLRQLAVRCGNSGRVSRFA